MDNNGPFHNYPYNLQAFYFFQDVFKIPEKMTFEHAAALADSYSTAQIVFNRHAKLKEKQTVLVTAAGGGLGLAAVDMATKIYKAKVTWFFKIYIFFFFYDCLVYT